jgi:DNA repair exonuclease SbcCD ATPase subunit
MKRWVAFLLAPLLLASAGCADIDRMLRTKVMSSPPSQAQSQLLEADRALRDGRYEEARTLYASAAQAGDREPVRQRARYGLACIEVLTAETLAQYRDGLQAVQSWSENATVEPAGEDPRFLLPVLEEHGRTLEELLRCRQESKERQKRYNELHAKYDKALKQLKQLRQEKEKLRRKIQKLENLYNELLDTRKSL